MSSSSYLRLSADERLSRIDAVTDAALAHLDLDELLNELLERLRELMDVDTAAVLLLDASSEYLVATAATGIEEEVRQGVRIPMGRGFAGRIAAEKRPVVLDKVDHTVVLNHLLWEKGIQSLLGVPLLVGGEVKGVLHVGTLRSRRFTEDDIELLQLVGDRLALALQIHISDQQRAAARALRHSLTPAKLPDVDGLEFASRYVPGERGDVAGDWYDVFVLPSGAVGIVVGDVAGHGFPAAVVMGRLRSALRAYALETQDPGEVLTKLNRKVSYFEPNVIATVLYAVLDPTLQRVELSASGHLAPIRCEPGQQACFVDILLDPPIGLQTSPRRSSMVALRPGTVLCFYSDGLVERRGTLIDDQLELLRESVTATEPEALCTALMARLVGNYDPEDDLTVLAVRRTARVQ